jgi:hypothetical protein
VLVLCLVVGICSTVSHLTVGWLKIKAGWGGYKYYGPAGSKVAGILYSSSPGYDGIDWNLVAEAIGGGIESWATAGSSPSEWEEIPGSDPSIKYTFIAVSAHDLNEYFQSDFRAEIVPFNRTLRDLRQCGADWQFSKRMLSQYPAMLVRKLFPTVGRSDGVMVGIRAKLLKLVGQSMDAGTAPKFGGTAKSDIRERVSDWTEARVQRRRLLLRAACQEKQSFAGPKRLALLRLLQRAEEHSKVILVVIPQPPIYRTAVFPPAAMQEFDEELAQVKREYPQLHVVRLDRLPALDHNDLYYDDLHLNMYGQQIATAAFQARLMQLAQQP